MLKKLTAIKNVGTFRRSLAHGDVELRRLTLIHAENGRGKTTLCAILRSLQSGQPLHMLERKTLDSPDDPQVHILHDTGVCEFKGGAWSGIYPNIEIFDAGFIAANVYSGDEITHDHKKSLCRVALGAEGVKLARAYDDCDASIRNRTNDVNNAAAKAQTFVPAGMTIDQFAELPADSDIDKKIEAKKAELAVVANAEAIRAQGLLAAVKLPELPAAMSETLEKTLDGASGDTAKKIAEHISRHKMGERGQTWLAEGLKYVAEDECPFCAQSVKDLAVIEMLRTFFGEAYRDFQANLGRFKTAVHTPLSDASLMAIQRRIGDNAILGEFWKPHIRHHVPLLSFDDQISAVTRKLRDEMDPLVTRKLASPFDKVTLPAGATAAIDAWDRMIKLVAGYNEQVIAFNALINDLKRSLETKDGTALRRELALLEAQKRRHEAEAIKGLLGYLEAQLAKAEAEKAKDKARQELEEHTEKVMGKYHTGVNAILEKIGAAFRLGRIKVKYTGRSPRAGYTFALRGKEIDPGSDRTPEGAPRFRNTLSSGDRNTLALAFFIAQVQNRPDLADLVIVFDDPFTSLDSFRQTWTCNILRKLSIMAKQVIVMSHSLEFLKLLAVRCDKAALRTLKIDMHNKIDSKIVELNLDDATAAIVDRDVVQLREFHNGDNKDLPATMRAIRPLLEHFIRSEAPGECPEGNGWLGDFLGKIKVAPDESALGALRVHYDDLDELNTYTSPYAHDSGKCPPINEQELHNYVGLSLKLIGRF